MRSTYETFWDRASFAVVGDSPHRAFPKLTYRGLKALGKTVFALDSTEREIDGDPVFRDLAALPQSVDAIVLEVPKSQTRTWIERAADAGIHDVWIHMGTESPDALALAKDRGLDARSGTCAVMYLTPHFSYHSLHKWAMKLVGRY